MTADWIAADWGTSHLRVWLMAADGAVLDRRSSADGMGKLAPDEFEPALLRLVGDALPDGRRIPVLICGMAGSKQGWSEAPYMAVPCAAPNGGDALAVATTDPRLDVHILPGLKQTRPADVMRGEETQIAGFIALNPGFDGVVCLPGTHCKWAHVSAREIVSFRTFMTGELFALIAGQSVLRHSVAICGWDDDAFASAIEEGISRPAAVAATLFSLRAESLLDDLSPETARARLSGLLIGMEIGAAKPYWLGREVAIIGDDALAGPYRQALVAQAVPVTLTDAERMTLEGLRAAYRHLKETSQ
ncbi:2-dehydro-3-deoxygalactonokinase [Puniceibacterium sp. IMCC21224]|uniref:2-dehydro-3-deoxygalactonokinase n=1 Tax=Puniceibacterium sp. IMCC21224 TaxID=1618204 RepID=UPI00064E0C12|nr:2-dehydro-3-deoxygalactonokinase [Puniceibacterium sp. IMCC21224]KMK67443.1 2-keto-3-deoxy-galactonokinase [Puniceibacterium sp. IMCC21224]